jgi:hypothetical protein
LYRNAIKPASTWWLLSGDHRLRTDNAFIEAFNSKLRGECLNAHWFRGLDDARAKLGAEQETESFSLT